MMDASIELQRLIQKEKYCGFTHVLLQIKSLSLHFIILSLHTTYTMFIKVMALYCDFPVNGNKKTEPAVRKTEQVTRSISEETGKDHKFPRRS